jgi:predicted ATPase
MLIRLCVFAGRFTLQDVEEVCASDEAAGGEALDALSSLVDKSLVVKETSRGVACYRLHDTMREYASRRLDDTGERQDVEERCTHYFVSTCQATALESRFRLLDWLAWMDLEIDNIRAVLRRCIVQGDLARAIDLAASLSWYWITRAQSEGVAWLDELLAPARRTPWRGAISSVVSSACCRATGSRPGQRSRGRSRRLARRICPSSW